MTITGLHNAPSCLAAHGYRGYLTYQPASRFWAFQGIETGVFVVLAAVLLGITFWCSSGGTHSGPCGRA